MAQGDVSEQREESIGSDDVTGRSARLAAYGRQHLDYLTRSGVYPGIDAARAVAIILVILYHFNFSIFGFGWLGVDIFFVISGFLVGGMIRDGIVNDRFSLRTFYRTRFLRILPLYYSVIAMYLVFVRGLGAARNDLTVSIRSVLACLVFVQTTFHYFFWDNGFIVSNEIVPGGTWSLVIEEYFYLICPALLIVLYRFVSERMVVVFLAAVLASGVPMRLHMTREFTPDAHTIYAVNFIQFHSRYDELAAGVIAAIIFRHLAKPSLNLAAIGLAMFSFLLVYLSVTDDLWSQPLTMTRPTIWFPTVVSIACSLMLLGVARVPLRSRTITVIARLAYPLYLVHLFWQIFLAKRIAVGDRRPFVRFFDESPFWVSTITQFAVIILGSYLLSLCVEYPFIRRYKRPALVSTSNA